MTAQRRYDLLINESEAVDFDYCKLSVVAAVLPADVSSHGRQKKLGFRRAPGRRMFIKTMTVQNLSAQPPFITKDGSTIRSILDRTNAPVQNQSLAEARVPAGGRTERHYHKVAEEFYFILEGAGEIELDGERR